MDIDKILGKQVRTGDGRIWTVISVKPRTFVDAVHGPVMTVRETMVRMDCATGAARAVQELPLALFVGALDYRLLEEV